MSGKIAIRRAGCFFPTLCLVAVVIFFGLLTWLSVVGLPDFVLRSLEETVEKEAGIRLHVRAIRLKPTSGLAAKLYDIRVEAPAPGLPEASIRKMLVQYRWHELMRGHYKGAVLTIEEGSVTQPVIQEPGAELKLTGLNGNLTLSEETEKPVLETRLHGNFQGIDLHLHALLPLPSAEDGGDVPPEEQSEGGIAEDIAPVLLTIYQEIKRQQWEKAPQIRLSYRQEGEKQRVRLRADLPSYEWQDSFHFRDAHADMEMQDFSVVIINDLSFRTVSPETSVSLQGGYDMKERRLDGRVESSASLVRLADSYLDEDPTGLTRLIQYEDDKTPHIKLEGTLQLTEEYQLNHIRLRGHLEQEKMRIGSSPVDRAELSFFYENGNFNLDNLTLTLPDGRLHATARAQNGKGEAELSVKAPAHTLLTLLQNLDEELTLPEGVSLQGELAGDINVTVDTTVFIPGKTAWEELIPEPKTADVTLSVGGILADGVTLTQPELSLSVGEIEAAEQRLGNVTLTARLKSLSAEEGTAEEPALKASVSRIHWEEGDERNVHLGAIKAEVTAGSSAHREMSARGIRLQAELPMGWDTGEEVRTQLAGASVSATAEELKQGEDFTAADLLLQATADDNEKGQLSFRATVGEHELRTDARLSLSADNVLTLQKGTLSLPLAAMEPLLVSYGWTTEEIRLPEQIEAQADKCLYDLNGERLLSADIRLSIPELVRTPQVVAASRGKEFALSVETQLHLSSNDAGDILYRGPMTVRHETGVLNAQLDGNVTQGVRVTGDNTIAVHIIDSLIDDEDAHFIMRDFHELAGKTRIKVSDIDADVRYDNGIAVHVLCHADMENLEYLMGSMTDEKDADGKVTGEHLRTDMGENPYTLIKHADCGVKVDVVMHAKDAEGNEQPFFTRIELTNPVLTTDNRPWQRQQKLKGGPAESTITGESVLFNLDNNTLTLNKLKGTAYPAYTIGAFYPDIREFMSTLRLSRPARLEAEQCVFPLALSCKVPMRGVIRAEADRGADFNFIGTTFPLEDFSGFINITDDAVLLDRMNARCWDGVINAAVRIGFAGHHTDFDGYVQADAVNLKKLGAAYNTELSTGLCYADFRFRCPSADVNALQGYGSARVTDADLMQLTIFRPVSSLISDLPEHLYSLQRSITGQAGPAQDEKPGLITRAFSWLFDTTGETFDKVGTQTSRTMAYLPFANRIFSYDVQNAYADYAISEGHLRTKRMTANGINLDLQMLLDLDLNTLELQGNIWPQISSVPTLLLAPISILSDYMLDLVLYGKLTDIQWTLGLDKKPESPAEFSDSIIPEEE